MTTNNRPIGPAVTPTPWLDRLSMLGAELRPDWDRPGIRAALARVSDRPLCDVAQALIGACARVDQRTPAVIALDGPHWRNLNTPAAVDDVDAQPVPPALRCEVCDQPADRCAELNARVAPEHRHAFTARRRRHDRTGTRLAPPRPKNPRNHEHRKES